MASKANDAASKMAGPRPKNKATVVPKARTNNVHDSLVKCEVNLDIGEWVTPPSCQIFSIDVEGIFPEIIYEIKTNLSGPYQWSWEMKWNVMACPQRREKKRFKPKKMKVFSHKGSFSSDSKRWVADLNGCVVGGELTVKVQVGSLTFMRKALVVGIEPGRERVLTEIDRYSKDFPREAELAKKIFQQESKFSNFYSDGQPLVSFDNGYGLGQSTNPEPSFEQIWSWKKHVNYILTVVIKGKRAAAKKYLSKYGPYNDDELDMETLVHYNGANDHYLIWDEEAKKWKVNDVILCDPQQSNKGWDMEDKDNEGKSLTELRKGKGAKPRYTGRCYAEHIKNGN